MTIAQPDARLDALVNLLYDAALDERLWCGLAARIATTFDSTSTVVKTHGTDDHVQLVEVTQNLVIAPKDQAWADYWHRNDLWVERTLAFGMSRIVTDEQLLPPAEFEKTAFYQDWNRHIGIYHLIGAAFPVDEQTVGVLGIHRTKQARGYMDADRVRVERFLPHLNRALKIRNRLRASSLVPQASYDALDRLDVAVIIVDAQCCILHANRVADTILKRPTELRVHCGRLTFTNPRLEAELVRRVQEATRTAAGTPQAPLPALLIDRYGRLPMTMLVTPLRPLPDQTTSMPPAAMVFIKDPEDGAPVQTTLSELFGLTRTEAAIAAAVANGQDIAQIAVAFRISIGTARSHLKTILRKTRTHRQSQLVSLIANSVASIRSAQL